jgi:hypothetical protein
VPFVVLAVVAGCGGEVAAPPGGDTSLLGRWETVRNSDSGFGSIFELGAGGKGRYAMAVVLNGTWTLAGTRLSTVLDGKTNDGKTNDGKAKVDESEIRVEGDSLLEGDSLVQGEGEKSIRWERVGPAEAGASTPLVGVWKYRWHDLADAYSRYWSDGRYAFRIVMMVNDDFEYEATDGTVTLLVGPSTERAVFRRVGDELVDDDDPDLRLRRADRAWYPLQPLGR